MVFNTEEFLEIVNNQAYTEYDLWSQIGGIIGIFLGQSILQVTLTKLQIYYLVLNIIQMR